MVVGGLFAELELEAPAVVADLGFAPGFERADLGEAGAQFDRDQALLGLLAEADDGVEGAWHVQLGIGGGEFDDLAQLVLGARERAVEAEGDGPIGDELQGVVIDLDGGALLGAAGHQAHRGERAFARLAEGDVIGSRKAAAHQHAAAGGAHVGVVGGAAGHGEIEIACSRRFRGGGRTSLPTTSATRSRRISGMKKPPLKRMASGTWPVGSRKAFEVPGDGGIGDVGQAELAEEAALFVFGRFAARGEREEAFERQLQRFGAQDLGFERPADEGRAGAEDGDLDALEVGIVEQPLLGGGALAAQAGALADGERNAELGLDEPGQREVEVVAAEQQVLADGGAGEVDQVALARDADEAEIAGAAADVADQHDLAVEELFARLGEVVGDPGIEGGGGLFEEGEALDAGIARGHDGEFAGFFVEGCGDGEDDVLFGQGRALDAVPLLAEFGDEAGGDFDGREHAAGLLGIPREDFGGAVDIGIGEPGFGGVDQAGGDQRALLAGVEADGLAILEEQERRAGCGGARSARRRPVGAFRRCGWAGNRGLRLRVRRCRRGRSWWCRGRCRSSCGCSRPFYFTASTISISLLSMPLTRSVNETPLR